MVDKSKETKERDEEIVGQVTGEVLHDFKNVLQGIIGLAEMLDNDPSLPEKARVSMQAIKKLGKNATKLVHSIGEDSEEIPVRITVEEEDDDLEIKSETTPSEQDSILLVEDDPMVLKVIASILKHLGYSTITAINGEDAFSIYLDRYEDIILVISDLVMPKMDGSQLANRILSHNPDAKIVIMTGYLQKEIDIDLQDPRIIGWLEKPVSIHQLKDIIEDVKSQA